MRLVAVLPFGVLLLALLLVVCHWLLRFQPWIGKREAPSFSPCERPLRLFPARVGRRRASGGDGLDLREALSRDRRGARLRVRGHWLRDHGRPGHADRISRIDDCRATAW